MGINKRTLQTLSVSGYDSLCKVYQGRVVPIPLSLISYLSRNELAVFSTIMTMILTNGCCNSNIDELAAYSGKEYNIVRKSLSSLESMGFIKRSGTGGRNKNIVFNNVYAIDDIMNTRKPGAVTALRGIMGTRSIADMTKRDIMLLSRYEYKDPVEEEEYK